MQRKMQQTMQIAKKSLNLRGLISGFYLTLAANQFKFEIGYSVLTFY